MTEAVSKVLQQNKISNKAYFSAVCSALGNRGGKTKKARRRSIQSSINGIQKKLDRQIREAEEMARQRNDHLLPDP
jgi:50S ribosomal subunit-associated GTPase HflX